MKGEQPTFEEREGREEMEAAWAEASALHAEILLELDRIRDKTGRGGYRLSERLFNEIFTPEGIGIDRKTLLKSVVYHGLIGSTPAYEQQDLVIDLPGEQGQMARAKQKLEELKAM